MKNDLRVRCVQSLFILVATILFMIALSVCGKLFFSLLLWLLGDGFNATWQDVLHGAKLGLYVEALEALDSHYSAFLK